MIRVVHCKKNAFDIYIGRPGKWGNPFHVLTDGTREEVVAKYERWIQQQPHLMKDLHELRGKVLGCWCAPKPCHGDVLVRLVNETVRDVGRRSRDVQRSGSGVPDSPSLSVVRHIKRSRLTDQGQG